jgi:hypothetical protein
LKDRSQELLRSCDVVDHEVAAVHAAFHRVVNKQRPSQNKEIKDSYLLEQCFAVARSLGGPTFPHWMLFVSSNTNDFADKSQSGAIHPDLANDFNAVGMRYAASLFTAVGLLRRAGQIPP